jgi:hypothetical protein
MLKRDIQLNVERRIEVCPNALYELGGTVPAAARPRAVIGKNA